MKSAVKLHKLVMHYHFKTRLASEFDIRMTLKFIGQKGTDVSIKENRYSQIFILQLREITPTGAVYSDCFFEANKVQNFPCCSINPHWGS